MIDRQAALANTLMAAQMLKRWVGAVDNPEPLSEFLDTCAEADISTIELLSGAMTLCSLLVQEMKKADGLHKIATDQEYIEIIIKLLSRN